MNMVMLGDYCYETVVFILNFNFIARNSYLCGSVKLSAFGFCYGSNFVVLKFVLLCVTVNHVKLKIGFLEKFQHESSVGTN